MVGVLRMVRVVELCKSLNDKLVSWYYGLMCCDLVCGDSQGELFFLYFRFDGSSYHLCRICLNTMYYPDPWPVTFFAGENSDDDQKYCTQLNGVVQWGSRRKRTVNFFPANTPPRKLKFSAKEQCQNYTNLVIILSMQCFCQLSLSGTSDLFVLVL